MSTTIVRFQKDRRGESAWGVVTNRRIRVVAGKYATLADFLERGAAKARKLAGDRGAGRGTLALEKATLLSPVTTDAQIVCQGKNYVDHIKETGFRPNDKTYNLIFTKAGSSLTGARGVIERPPGVRLLDYEIELGLVIGKTPARKSQDESVRPESCVAGIVVANDVSARDIQVPQGQWFKGKSFRTFCPVGPYLVLLDRGDFGSLSDLELNLRVNGETRQHAFVRQMIYSPAETLSELAGLMTLRPGDLVLTGTPSGVAMRVPGGWRKKLAQLIYSEGALMKKFVQLQEESGRYLQDGDVIHASIATADGSLDLGMQELTVQSRNSNSSEGA
ncbi:MAG: fumarylacetoacetate hydrolase family protein [Leptospirales bacterium]|jgi:2,4-diketo-3-deoxy-L-fuconate hydrolase